jgi:hypothetical protein
MGEAKRESLSGNLAKSVKFHFRTLDPAGYTVERQKSVYPTAKADLVIFDSQGQMVIKGREFGGGQFSLWTS